MDRRKNTEKLNNELINLIQEDYLKTKSSRETAKNCNVSKTTVLEYVKPINSVRISDDERKKRRIDAVAKRRKKLKLMAIEYKGGCCQHNNCGYNMCIRALEFHHLDSSKKDFGLSSKGHTYSWERIKKELDKCILVCANCHREIEEELDSNK